MNKKRNIKPIKEFKGSSELKKIKQLHAKDLKIKTNAELNDPLELIEKITSTESLFKKKVIDN